MADFVYKFFMRKSPAVSLIYRPKRANDVYSAVYAYIRNKNVQRYYVRKVKKSLSEKGKKKEKKKGSGKKRIKDRICIFAIKNV